MEISYNKNTSRENIYIKAGPPPETPTWKTQKISRQKVWPGGSIKGSKLNELLAFQSIKFRCDHLRYAFLCILD
ncbi:hypothetical protein KIN20_027157 [Parelaphostrongylus tenuis]|uniref:Uncharacterized protein n=1 Tax=Parelaphostrongylus tenuis TaxID=148309 RepID=A0AAD5QZ18_PARTN|nr:hypothetical protein KIN20_027157 [Parelaphostrongylus tenuis]